MRHSSSCVLLLFIVFLWCRWGEVAGYTRPAGNTDPGLTGEYSNGVMLFWWVPTLRPRALYIRSGDPELEALLLASRFMLVLLAL